MNTNECLKIYCHQCGDWRHATRGVCSTCGQDVLPADRATCPCARCRAARALRGYSGRPAELGEDHEQNGYLLD